MPGCRPLQASEEPLHGPPTYDPGSLEGLPGDQHCSTSTQPLQHSPACLAPCAACRGKHHPGWQSYASMEGQAPSWPAFIRQHGGASTLWPAIICQHGGASTLWPAFICQHGPCIHASVDAEPGLSQHRRHIGHPKGAVGQAVLLTGWQHPTAARPPYCPRTLTASSSGCASTCRHTSMRSLLSSSSGTGRCGASPRRRMCVMHSIADAVALFMLAAAQARTHHRYMHIWVVPAAPAGGCRDSCSSTRQVAASHGKRAARAASADQPLSPLMAFSARSRSISLVNVPATTPPTKKSPPCKQAMQKKGTRPTSIGLS